MQNNNNLYRAYYTRYQCELIPMNKKILTIDCLIRKEKQRKENEINYDQKYENYCLKFQKKFHFDFEGNQFVSGYIYLLTAIKFQNNFFCHLVNLV